MAKEYKVEEVNAGICTCTIRGAKVQEVINASAKAGWNFEQFQTIVGRRCGCIPAPKILIAFSKEI
jgi:hypothetical protein